MFHALAAAAADDMIGGVHQSSENMRPTLMLACSKPVSSIFLVLRASLQQRRHKADYDPGPRFKTADAIIAIGLAREAITLFQAASDAEKKLFLTLLVCPPR